MKLRICAVFVIVCVGLGFTLAQSINIDSLKNDIENTPAKDRPEK